MKKSKTPLLLLSMLMALPTMAGETKRMVRIAEIEIVPQYLDAYQKILVEEASASIRLEPGVLSIFPMFEADHPEKVRILEIYASREAYAEHLKSDHFLRYKSLTQKMVASLRLVEMGEMEDQFVSKLFKKAP
ncbi:MAG: antibiotic biosynthesis monooxygenase [Marinilabiliales bacterium]|nr:antibiotic biosynthesis monooxygenase [Marinilabiliales bacterium]